MSAVLRITVVQALAQGQAREHHVQLQAPATVAQALAQCGLLEALEQGSAPTPLPIGVWGRRTSLAAPLHDLDRVELYQALRVDPKVARRERFKSQGSRGTGLFAKRRPGAKAGY